MVFFAAIEKSILEFIWNLKGCQIAKAILKRKNKDGFFTISDFKTYCKAAIMQTVWDWHKDRYVDQ